MGTSPLLVLRRSKWPYDGRDIAPRTPQEGPRGSQDGPKMAPKRPQDGSKSLPRRVQQRVYVSLTPKPPEKPPRPLPDLPRGRQDGPKRAPRGPQEGPRSLIWALLGAILGPLGETTSVLLMVLPTMSATRHSSSPRNLLDRQNASLTNKLQHDLTLLYVRCKL